MGGGGESSAPPVDLMGGQYASFSGGTPSYDWSGLGAGVGKGMQQFGASMQNQPVPNYVTGSQPYAQANIPAAQPQTNMIPSLQDLKKDNSKDDLAEAIQRLMASGAESAKLRQAWDWQFRTKGIPTELLQPDFTPYMGLA